MRKGMQTKIGIGRPARKGTDQAMKKGIKTNAKPGRPINPGAGEAMRKGTQAKKGVGRPAGKGAGQAMRAEMKTRMALGRPAGEVGDRVRSDLLEAARQLFLSNELKAVSIREIAAKARVNGAMVSYYFGSKQGLYLSMVEELLSTLRAKLYEMQPGEEVSIAEFSATYCTMLAANPWWPNFMVRKVLFSHGEVRDVVIKIMATVFVPKLLHAIHSGKAQKQFRADLNPGLALLSVMGMTIFPFLAKPVVEQVLHLQIDARFAEQLDAHNTRLFLNGVLQNPHGTSRKPATATLTGKSSRNRSHLLN